MERTKYTPKRLLSLLLALIMLLGMLPTAALAAEPAGGIVLNSDDYKAHGLIFKFEPILPEGPYFENSTDKAVTIHYTISTATGKDYVKITELSEFVRYNNAEGGEIANSRVHVKASDITDTNMVEDATGGATATPTTVKVFKPGVVIAQGDVTEHPIISADDGGTGKIVQKTYFAAQWVGAFTSENYNTNETVGETSIKTMTVSARYLPLGYSVSYNDGGYTGTAGIPVGTFRTTGSGKDNQSFTISDVTPTLAGCTFKGWSSDTWENKDADGNPVLFQPGDAVEKVTSDTVLTAVWDENASEHKVEFYHNFPNGSDETLFTTVHVADGEGAENPGAPYKHPEGYIFKDWCVKAEVGGKVTLTPYDFAAPVTEDIKLYADWTQVTEETTHSVKFVRNNATDGSATNWPNDLTGAEGEKVKIPWTTPTAERKTFLGWSTTENATAAETDYARGKEVTLGDKDIILYAVWKADTVTIIYPTNNRPWDESHSPEGTDEYDGVWISETGKKTNVTRGSKQTFTVRLDDGYDPQYLLVIKNTKNAADTSFVGRGLNYVGSYTPQHWVEGQQKYTEYYYEYYADEDEIHIHIDLPQKIKYTVTLPVSDKVDVAFKDETIAGNKSTTVKHGENVTFKVTARPGYTVKGVYVNGEKKGNAAGEYTISNITANQTVTVDVEAIVLRNVTYVLDGAQMATQQVEDGTAFTPLNAPTKTGYTFDGWYRSAEYKEVLPDSLSVTKDTIFYGRYVAKTYEISFDSNLPADYTGTAMPLVPTPVKKTYGQAVQLPTWTPSLPDGSYQFKGWSTIPVGEAAYAPGATFSAEITSDVTLYAIWEKTTYTITLQSGSGYTISTDQATVVKHGETFAFTVTVDGAYAATEPTVTATPVGGTAVTLTKKNGEPNSAHTAAEYTYEIANVTADQIVSVKVTENERVTVNFQYRVVDKENKLITSDWNTKTYMTQLVQLGDPATQPMQPTVEGYTFVGWCTASHTADTPVAHTNYDFAAPVTGELTIYAEITPIIPKITVVTVKDEGWETKNWTHGTTSVTPSPDTNATFSIAYGEDLTFDLVIEAGYDYSKLSVSANGYALGYDSITANTDGSTTIQYYLGYITADTRISITGIERKTITVTYNENALDHVSNLPAPQTANYWIGGKNNTKFTAQVPVRNGYTFLGWALSGTATTPDYKIGDIKNPGVEIPFTADTTVYAIWEAKDLSAELLISDEFINSSSSAHQLLDYAYEGERIYLTGKLSAPAQGTMTFYKRLTKPGTIWVAAEDWTLIGTATVNGSQYGTIETTAEPYRWDNLSEVHAKNYRWDYKVVFTPANEEGYKECTGHDDLRVYSKAISWDITKPNAEPYDWGDAKRSLTIYTNEARTDKTTTMTANNTYWLQIPQVIELDGGLNLKNNKDTYLTVGQHYEIIWEYQDSENHWTTYTTTTDTDWVKVTPELSGYTFRAKVKPSASSIYTKAATYTDANALVPDVYWDYLITAPTNATVVEETKTTLTIDTGDELNSIVIKNEKPFETLGAGSHKAQFEGQTITLTAKVTKTDVDETAVNMGTVEFYRQVTGENDTTSWVSIGTAKLEDEGTVTGEASIEFQMPKYVAGKTPIQNKEVFKAVYVQNVTYKTSESAKSEAYIKSAQLQIPVIADVDTPTAHTGKWIDAQGQEVTNGDNKTATSYDYHLGGLTAGIKHTFQLKQTGANQTDTADWSVVALDGRTVAGDMYTMKWETLTDANWKTTTTTGDTYTAETTKVGDRYHILLTGAKNSPFDGSKVVSKDIAIGDPQGVTVTVEAIDAIKATEVDRNNDKYPDVYQLNEITLTATVEAAEAGADRKPTGTVAFYYVDENNAFQPLGEAELIKDKSGKMVAQITTDELPVEKKTGKNTNLTSVITAVYYGDETFKPSENWSLKENSTTEWEITSAEGTNKTIKTDKVTVYSSVVYNCTDENNNLTTDGERGIHISKADGLFLANESATLKLSDVYTLDWELGDDLRDIVAKLNPNKDYTIQWQKLTGVSEKENRDFAKSERWEVITGATGTTLLLKPVEQDTAYRAVITVKDPATPIVKGSFELIDQGTVNTKDANDGRQVYYSNVMMPTSGEATIAVAVNTNERGDNLEGITEGETVTVNVLVSGAVGAVPNATLNVTITADDTKGNATGYEKTFTSKATVDGWNAFEWDTRAEQVQPGFYTLTVEATSNTGYMTEQITRSLIVRESSYDFNIDNQTTTYNGQTQGVTVTLNGFDFKGSDINEAAKKSWTVKYYDKDGKLVEPSQAGTYTAKVTLPASAYWTEKVEEFTFTIEQRKVYVEDAVAQAKVYDGKTNVNLVEVILNDAETDQGTTGLPTNDIGIINGDSIYATATGTLRDANAGENEFTVSDVQLHGDDADNYVVDETVTYKEPIYVSRSQVYGETGTLKLKQGEQFPADQVIKMIDQAGNELKANEGYTLTFYYHSDTKIEKTEDLSKTGLYTVVARPKQDNYKGGVTMKFEVVKDAADAQKVDAAEPQPSALIDLTNTATMYNPMGNVGVTATSSQDNTVEVKYQNGTDWSTDVPANAGRYLVKATDAISGDVAYGIYTITKAHPEIRITAEGTTYNSMPYDVVTKVVTENNGAESYLTYAGDVAIGFDTPTDGNVAEQAPVDAGSYVVTLHVNETTNYTAHEVSAPFVIAQKPLTITTHSKQSTQYDAFPAMTAKYEGLAYSTSDNTNDTSLRDVQIAPEFLFNYDKGGFTNHALDQVGGAKIKPADALAKNYVITYVDGEYTRQRTNFKPDLAIYGLPVNGNGENVAYYGDEVQLYHYGYYTDHENGSSVMRWSVMSAAGFVGNVTIGEKTGILNVNGVGTFEVTLKRGEGEQAISTTVTVTAIKREVQIALKEVDKVYNGSEQGYEMSNITVHDELYRTLANFEGKLTTNGLKRTNIGTQIPTAKVTGAWSSQSETYGGQFTINDKEATVAPKEDTHIYGQTRQIKGYDDLSNALINGLTASQTDDYNRLDVHDGYEILVAGTENMNYNVKYVTDQTAKDSAVTTYGGVKFTSETTEYLNDATVYGETPNVLDWTLENTIESIRGSKSYADNLADFDLESIFVEQDYDNCVNNADCGKFDYKAANRTTTAPDTYNVGVLGAKRTAANENAHSNYTLKFKTVTNSGATNYLLTDAREGNKNTTTNALRAGSLGYDGGNATLEAGENFVEGSANIAQRPVTVKKASTIGTVRLYWRLPQSKLYTALLNILEAEGNSTNRGLAKGHTIRDLDLTISIQGKPIDPNSNNALEGLTKGDAQVVVKVGDTNYVLDGDGKIGGVELKTIQIEATYTTKTATNFVVLIKVRNEDGRSTTPLKSADGLTYEILRKVNGSFDGKVYATGSLTYTGRTATDKFGDACGVFTASYGPLSNIGGTYFIQMYEYGVALKTENS